MLKVETINNVYVASFDNINRFNALIAEPIKEQLNSLFTKPDTNLVLNLDGISYIDSTGFGVFLSVLKTSSSTYGHFKICNVNKEVKELFRLLQLHTIFDIQESLDDCLTSFMLK